MAKYLTSGVTNKASLIRGGSEIELARYISNSYHSLDVQTVGREYHFDIKPAPKQVNMCQTNSVYRRSGLDGSVQTDEEYENELELIYGAQHVILIFVPVIICMLVVSIIISSLSFFATNDGQYL